MTDTDTHVTDEEFKQHQAEIHRFIRGKVDELGLHQTIRLIGHTVTSETSMYRAKNTETGNPELVTLFTQDHASSMTYWAEAEIGVQEIHGMTDTDTEDSE